MLLVAIVISRIFHERGYRTLDSDSKLRLMDGFSKTRAYSIIPLLALIGVYWFLLSQTNVNKSLLHIGFFGLLIVYVIVRSILNQKKLTQLNMPADYCKKFAISQLISFLGLAWFMFAFLTGI